MYKPTNLRIQRLMSFDDQSYQFDNKHAVMVQGRNLTDDGQQSNGSGKSALLEAIAIALTGSPLRGVSVKDLVQDDAKSMDIELTLKSKNDILYIRRVVWSNTKSAELYIELNKKIPPTLQVNSAGKIDVKQGNAWILNHIGISRSDLLNYYLVSKEKFKSFLAMSDTEKKQVISRFSQADLVDPAYDLIQQRIDKNNADLHSIEHQMTSTQSKIDVYKDEINNFDLNEIKQEVERRKLVLKTNIASYNKQISAFKNDIVNFQSQLKQLEKELISLPKVDNSQQSKLQSEIEKLEAQINQWKIERSEIQKLQAEIEVALQGTTTCPKCGHEFSVTDDSFDLIAAKDSQSEFISVIAEIDADIGRVHSEIDNIEQQIRKQRQLQQSNHEKRMRLRSQYNTIEQQITRADNAIKSLTDQIRQTETSLVNLQTQVIQDKTAEYQQNIDNLTKELGELQTQKQVVEQKLFDANQWNTIVTRFKTHLSNKAIAVIQAYVNEYLQQFGSNITIQFDGYKITKTGKIRENISVKVLRNGLVEGMYARYSSGERTRIKVATILALQQLINRNASIGLDLLFLDEIIESSDELGVVKMMDLLNKLNQTILAVTHGSFNKNYPYIITVEKKNAKSTII